MDQERKSGGAARRERWVAWTRWTLIGYWTLLFIGTHTPTAAPMPQIEGIDKVAHIVGYGGLAVLCAAYAALRWGPSLSHALWIVGILAVYGVLDELLQIPVGRECDVWDWVADMAGVLIGLACFYALLPLARRRGWPA